VPRYEELSPQQIESKNVPVRDVRTERCEVPSQDFSPFLSFAGIEIPRVDIRLLLVPRREELSPQQIEPKNVPSRDVRTERCEVPSQDFSPFLSFAGIEIPRADIRLLLAPRCEELFPQQIEPKNVPSRDVRTERCEVPSQDFSPFLSFAGIEIPITGCGG